MSKNTRNLNTSDFIVGRVASAQQSESGSATNDDIGKGNNDSATTKFIEG